MKYTFLSIPMATDLSIGEMNLPIHFTFFPLRFLGWLVEEWLFGFIMDLRRMTLYQACYKLHTTFGLHY